MRGPSSQARLPGIDYPHFPENLAVAEPTGSAHAQFVPAAEKPSDTLDHVPADRCIGIARIAKAEVRGPSDQKAVEPETQLGPGCRVSPEQQSVDLL
jgi:hypothetical protein